MKVAMVHFLITHPRLLPVRLTLLVPELIWPEPNDQLTLGKLSVPGFEWLAARANFERQAKQPFETALAAQFGLDAAPFGALRLLGYGLDVWLESSPWGLLGGLVIGTAAGVQMMFAEEARAKKRAAAEANETKND